MLTVTDFVLIGVFLLLLLVVIAYVVILMTTGFTKTGRMSGGLYCLTAPPSNGKSYVATHIGVEFLKKGRRVFSNYPIVYNDGRRILQTCALTKDMLLEHNFNGSVIIIDEAHNWFWSRKFKEFTEEFKNWFSTLSQHEISLYYIVQHEDRVDTVINDCANLFGVIEKKEIPILEMPIFFIVTWWVREIDMQFARNNPNIDPFHTERIWFDRDIAQSYDTKFFGTDKRPEYEGIPWVKWLKDKYGFDYKGNYNFSVKTQIKNWIYAKVYTPIHDKYTYMKELLMREIGNRFDRNSERSEENRLEASGGVPSGASRSSQLPIDENRLTYEDLLEPEEGEDDD